MKRLALMPLVAEAQVLSWRFGMVWPLIIASAFLLLALYWGVLMPKREVLAAAKAESDQASVRKQAMAAEPASNTEAQQLESLKTVLRGSTETTELILRLSEIARAEQITLTQSEYHQQKHTGTGLVQLQVAQPVKAAYPQLKHYVETVLRTLPNVSLDQIAVRRDNVGQAQLDVRLRWTFWIQPAEDAK